MPTRQDQLNLEYQKALQQAQAAQAKVITACDPSGREKWLVDSTCFGAKLNAQYTQKGADEARESAERGPVIPSGSSVTASHVVFCSTMGSMTVCY